MTLIKSISGIRGTIGGQISENLSPIDIVKFTTAYSIWLKNNINKKNNINVVVGRDARISGYMINHIVVGTLLSMGINVIDIGLTTTPTTEIAVKEFNADGGIIITASHNPQNWNALKLLNNKGEFLSAKDGNNLLEIAENGNICYTEAENLGNYTSDNSMIEKHIEHILNLKILNINDIKNANFTITIDCINSTGAIALPPLMKALGVNNIHLLNNIPNGIFSHNPEPLPENITELTEKVVQTKSDLGIIVDPDVDRLAFVAEDGSIFGEEYTLVAVADYVLSKEKGNTVSNLSSSIALKDISSKYGCNHYQTAVGEVNVIEKMKETNAIIGGEGNGGVIYPELHYGRDALVGIALFLSHLASSGKKCSELRKTYPNYFIAKKKLNLIPEINIDALLQKIKTKYSSYPHNTIDGLKIEFGNEWVHLRKSNTEPIIRIYAESSSEEKANKLANTIIDEIKQNL
jgi:phosphomannomutase